ncbi:MAG TPA: glucosaminidase domain-containing protein [Ktedonobacteraceae bacterium]|nr:glucosaminidase domain-containing protein [Ktedonobacteraceae bacterium]
MSNASYPRPYPPQVPIPTLYPPPLPKKRSPLTLLLTCLAIVCMFALCSLLALGGTFLTFHTFHSEPTPAPTPTPIPTLPPLKVYSVVGKPTVDAAFINSVLSYYDSPASGKGQALYDDGVQYGINPAYALAFFLEESNFGTKGVATVTHALGNIRASDGMPQYKGYRAYKTWEEGFADWYKLIATQYVEKWNLSTVDQIIPVYAPSADHNDETQYISAIKIAIERWRNGYVDI